MIDTTIKEFLTKNTVEGLDFKALLEIMEASGIEFRNRKMHGPSGIATYYCIYLDIETMRSRYPYYIIYFVILHEMAHYKRICRMGKGKIIEMLSAENKEVFSQHVINEEIIADRYACYSYQRLNGKEFPRVRTQRLHIPEVQREYKEQIIQYMFGRVKNNEESYIALWESFIINE